MNTAKEINLEEARELFVQPPTDMVAQSEAAMLLKTRFKLSRQEIADVLGISLRQVMTRLHDYKKLAAKGLIPTGLVPELGGGETPHESVVQDELERRNRLASGKEARAVLNDEILFSKLSAAIAPYLPNAHDLSAIERLYKSAKAVGPRAKDRSEEIAMGTMSDLHLCLKNRYHDFERGMRANDRFIEKMIRLTDFHRKNFDVKTIHLNALGDNMQGTSNYPAQRWDCDRPAVDQSEALTQVLVQDIETLLIDFDKVVVNCAVGNHGYVAPHKTSLDPDQANWEMVTFRALQWAFRGNPRVTFNIPDDWYQVVSVWDNRFLFTHGHKIAGAGSLDGIVNMLRKWNDVLPRFDYAVIGHFHRFNTITLPREHGSNKDRFLFINGTAVDNDDHVQQFGGSPTPLYHFWFMNQKNLTAKHDIRLY